MGLFQKFFGPPAIQDLKEKRDTVGLESAVHSYATNRPKDRERRLSAVQALRDLGQTYQLVRALVSWNQFADRLVTTQNREKLPEAESTISEITAALHDCGEASVAPLIEFLEERHKSNWPVSAERAMTRVLVALRDPRAAPLFMEFLKEEVQWSGKKELAEKGLRNIGSRRIALLLEQKNVDTHHASLAALALAFLGDPHVLQSLIAALDKERNWEVRQAAAQALGQLGDPSAVEPLLAALKGNDDLLSPYVRRAAAESLGKLHDPRAVEPLLSALRDEDPTVRRAAAESLGKLHDPRAVEPLLSAFRDEDPTVRRAAAESLGALGDRRAVDALIDALSRDEFWFVRQWAADALGWLRDERAVAPLAAALQDTYSQVRYSAQGALHRIHSPQAQRALAEHRARHK